MTEMITITITENSNHLAQHLAEVLGKYIIVQPDTTYTDIACAFAGFLVAVDKKHGDGSARTHGIRSAIGGNESFALALQLLLAILDARGSLRIGVTLDSKSTIDVIRHLRAVSEPYAPKLPNVLPVGVIERQLIEFKQMPGDRHAAIKLLLLR